MTATLSPADNAVIKEEDKKQQQVRNLFLARTGEPLKNLQEAED